jgi:hypothetical protein
MNDTSPTYGPAVTCRRDVRNTTIRGGFRSAASPALRRHMHTRHIVASAIFRTVLLPVLLMATTTFGTNEKPFRPNLLIYSAGSWMVLSDNDHAKPYPYIFNKFTRTLYCQIFSLSAMAKIPLDLTIPNTSTSPRMWFGDLDFYVGKRFGWIEPKIGLELPLGYGINDNWKKLAWIGTNNVRLQTGFSISRARFETIGLPFGAEAMLSVALTENNAHYERGSLTGQLYIKTSHNFTRKLSGGGELALYGKSGVPTWSSKRRRENGFTLLPALFGTCRMGKKIYLGAKFGFGPSFGINQGAEQAQHRSNAIDCGISRSRKQFRNG